jgi:zinc protease
VSSSYDDTAIDPIAYSITAIPAPGKDVHEVEQAVDGVIQDLLKNGVTDAEVADAKTRLQAQAILARDSLSGPAHSIGEAVATGQSIEDVENWPDDIAAVTTAQVNEAMRGVLGNGVTGVTGWLLPADGNTRAPTDAAAAANTVPAASGPIR